MQVHQDAPVIGCDGDHSHDTDAHVSDVTAIAKSSAGVRRQARAAASPADLNDSIRECRACPRLVSWCQDVAVAKRAAYADETYWGAPVPSFGADRPSILIIGLAPGAHGANRTGRMFTGDRSGDWLFGSLHRTGLASTPGSVSRDDGQRLEIVRITAAVRCAPPDNKPTTEERDTCAPWLDRELELVNPDLRVVVALGGFAWSAALAALATCGWSLPTPRPRFGHGVHVNLERKDGHSVVLLGCYHPSQQNTFTGRLTEPMLDEVFTAARRLASGCTIHHVGTLAVRSGPWP